MINFIVAFLLGKLFPTKIEQKSLLAYVLPQKYRAFLAALLAAVLVKKINMLGWHCQKGTFLSM